MLPWESAKGDSIFHTPSEIWCWWKNVSPISACASTFAQTGELAVFRLRDHPNIKFLGIVGILCVDRYNKNQLNKYSHDVINLKGKNIQFIRIKTSNLFIYEYQAILKLTFTHRVFNEISPNTIFLKVT